MSAFIVSYETMNYVVASILPFRSDYINGVFLSFEPHALARNLYELNNRAIEARYGKLEHDPSDSFRFTPAKLYSPYELIKAA